MVGGTDMVGEGTTGVDGGARKPGGGVPAPPPADICGSNPGCMPKMGVEGTAAAGAAGAGGDVIVVAAGRGAAAVAGTDAPGIEGTCVTGICTGAEAGGATSLVAAIAAGSAGANSAAGAAGAVEGSV